VCKFPRHRCIWKQSKIHIKGIYLKGIYLKEIYNKRNSDTKADFKKFDEMKRRSL